MVGEKESSQEDQQHMTVATDAQRAGSLDIRVSNDGGTLTFIMTGRWDSDTTGKWWARGRQLLSESKPREVVIDASG